MQYSISESRLVKLIKSLFGKKDVPKSLVDTIREKYVNSYLSGFKKSYDSNFHGWGNHTKWDSPDGERMISVTMKGREGNLINVNEKMITSFSGLLGVSKEEAINLVINWIRPQIKGKILSYQTFSFGA
jgi:hypothetical protein